VVALKKMFQSSRVASAARHFVVDVCGGLGRVARRLAPVVGQDGLVISIEMFRCLSDRRVAFGL